MKREAAAAVAGLGLGLALGVSGDSRSVAPPQYPAVWHMSKTTKVPIKGNSEQCLLHYGSPLVPTPLGVMYPGQANDSTECPEGTVLHMSPLAARSEEQAYRRLEARRQAIAAAVLRGTHEEPAMVVDETVTIANPHPITKVYADRSREHWYYGQECGAYGVAIRAGVLVSGEVVWKLQEPVDGPYRPDGCPPGTMFVQAGFARIE